MHLLFWIPTRWQTLAIIPSLPKRQPTSQNLACRLLLVKYVIISFVNSTELKLGGSTHTGRYSTVVRFLSSKSLVIYEVSLTLQKPNFSVIIFCLLFSLNYYEIVKFLFGAKDFLLSFRICYIFKSSLFCQFLQS